jgi:hypothetical protein
LVSVAFASGIAATFTVEMDYPLPHASIQLIKVDGSSSLPRETVEKLMVRFSFSFFFPHLLIFFSPQNSFNSNIHGLSLSQVIERLESYANRI